MKPALGGFPWHCHRNKHRRPIRLRWPAHIFPNCTRATFLDYCLSLSSISLVSGALTLSFFVGLVLALAATRAFGFR